MSKRRGNNEGSIYRRKDGYWVGQYRVQASGGEKVKYIYGKKRADVATKLARAIADRDSGTLDYDAEGMTVGEFLDRWLRDSVADSVRPRTLANYQLQVRRHIVPSVGRTELVKLSPAQVQGLYRAKLGEGLSPASVRYVHAVLRRALGQALRWGLVPRNACEAVSIPGLIRKEIQALTPEEVREFLEAAIESGDRHEALYVLAVTCGLRQGELLGLKWSDIDLDTGTMRVNRQLQRMRDGSGLKFASPKTAKGRRTVRLSAPAVDALRRHGSLQADEMTRAGELYEDQGLVFATAKGTPLDAQNVVNRYFKPLLAKAGLPQVRFHDLRHTCATLLLGKGVHPRIVQEMLGHASVGLTLDTYSHVLPDMQGQAVTAMDELLE